MQDVLDQIQLLLKDEPVVTGVLARGFAAYEGYPSFEDRYGLKALAIAQYPMYRGVARLVGMDVKDVPSDTSELVPLLERHFEDYDFFFLHFKYTDSRGEDGDFDNKVHEIEHFDGLLPRALALSPEVLAITCDHSTPCVMKGHSWHPNPFLLKAEYAFPDCAERFTERNCQRGSLGHFPSLEAMPLMLAHAGRLAKFGA